MAVTSIALHSLSHLHPSSLIHNLQARRSAPSSPFQSHMGSTLLSMSGHGLPSMSPRAGTYWKPSGRGLRQCRQSSSSATVKTQCLANSLSPLAHILPSQSSTSDHNTPSVSRSSTSYPTRITTSTALGTGPGNSAVLVGSIFGGVIVFAAAVYAAYRFIIIPRLLSHNCSRRSSVAESRRPKGDHRSSAASVSSLSTLPNADATKPAAKRPDTAVTVTPKLRPLPPIPTLSQISPTLFSPPTSATVTPPDPLDTSHSSAPTPRAATLAKLDTSVAPTFAPSPHTTPLARRSGLDQSDAASSLWARRHSAASSWSVGVSRTGSPVPSSATSQMYRIRDSVWALVRSHSREEFVDLPMLPHRKAASFDGLKWNAVVTVIPDVPPLPARFRAEGRQSVG
ncbi:hypothetical protein C8Q74DRAFT_1052912 [Fomes fomentarius]|nr:hypothetical protein C8Q74DRAFT_1052912 [Fomes fomentarius]